MQKDQNLLDRYLQEKVEEAHFEFREEYWEQAAKMLDDEDERRKPVFWRRILFVSFFVLVGAGTFLFSKLGNRENSMAANRNEQASTYNNTMQAGTPLAGSNENNTLTPGNTNSEHRQPVTEPVAVKDEIAHASTGGSHPVHTSLPLSGVQTPNTVEDIATNEHLPGPRATHGTGKPAGSNIVPGRIPARSKTPQVKPNTTSDMLNGTLPVIQKGKPANTRAMLQMNGKQMEAVDTQISLVARIPRDETRYNPRYQASLRGYVAERDTQIVLTYQPVADIPAQAPAPIIVKDTVETRKNGFNFIVSGGGTFNKGFKGNMSTSASWGLTPYLNAGVERDFGKKITMAAQVGFTWFNALNIEQQVHHYKYSFGFDSTSFTIQYQKLLQLQLPVSLYMQLYRNHGILSSIGAVYTFNTASRVKQPGQSSTQTSLGYTEGFNPFDLFVQFGYQLRASEKISIQAFLQQGLMDATKNSYFNNSVRNAQTRFSIGFKYNFKRNGN